MKRFKNGIDQAVEILACHLRRGDGVRVILMQARGEDAPHEIYSETLKKLNCGPFIASDDDKEDGLWQTLLQKTKGQSLPVDYTVFSGGFKTTVMKKIEDGEFRHFGFILCDEWDLKQWDEMRRFLRRLRKLPPVAVVLVTAKPPYLTHVHLRTVSASYRAMSVPWLDADDARYIFKIKAPKVTALGLSEGTIETALNVSNHSLVGMRDLASSFENQHPINETEIGNQLSMLLAADKGVDGRRVDSKFGNNP